jgi:DNA-binding transcriptional LysR family regulator
VIGEVGAVELRQLRYFIAVAEELHFGRAAARLNIVQPAVSQQLSRLERELGVRLLERSPRRVALTSDGIRLLAEARAALAAVDRVTTIAGELAAGRAATVRVGTGPGMGERVVRGIDALRASTPDLGIMLVEGSAAEHCAAVRDGTLDLALVRGAVSRPGLRAVELWREPLVAILPAARADADLADLVLRLPERRSDPALYDAVLAACAEAGFSPRLGRPVRSLEATMVEIGAGAGEWTVVYEATPRTIGDAVVERPFAPPLTVAGQLVVAAGGPPDCLASVVAAFSGART